ncbi:MAG TPA: ATP-binding protein [Gaiellaceae bacterium]|nr:ATP-binding protein [Gaiellaceae bacterium]
MSRRFLGVRWWLGAAFAVVAALSTAIVVSQFSTRSENAVRGHVEAQAVNSAVGATQRFSSLANVTPRSIAAAARRSNLQLVVYSRSGTKIAASPDSRPTRLDRDAVATVLRGDRFRESTSNGRIFVVGLPLHGGVLLARSVRPDVQAAIGILNDQALRAGLIAGLIGVAVGLLLAQLIALRLRRLMRAAEAIALGNFETPLRHRFHDEFGALAQSFERMRRQLRRSFRRIEAERDRLRMLLERLHEGVVTVDDQLVVRFANAEARRLLGGRLTEGDPLPDPWPGFSLREFASALFDSDDGSLAQAHVRPDDERALALVGIPSQPETDNVMIVLDDLTEAERRELAEREFVTNAAHELRTPLTTIIGAVEVLQSGAKDDAAERDRFLAHIEREAERLARLARAMLTLARAHSGQEQPRPELVALGALLEDIADDLRPAEGVAVEVDAAPDLDALVNRDLLEQAVRNLADNAVKHTRAGRIVLRAYATGTNVRVEVEDTGAGMNAATQRHVFDRFYRGQDRDAEGFGLGLAIVRQAVLTIGGRVELESAPGKGTLVRIELRRARVRAGVPA